MVARLLGERQNREEASNNSTPNVQDCCDGHLPSAWHSSSLSNRVHKQHLHATSPMRVTTSSNAPSRVAQQPTVEPPQNCSCSVGLPTLRELARRWFARVWTLLRMGWCCRRFLFHCCKSCTRPHLFCLFQLHFGEPWPLGRRWTFTWHLCLFSEIGGVSLNLAVHCAAPGKPR